MATRKYQQLLLFSTRQFIPAGVHLPKVSRRCSQLKFIGFGIQSLHHRRAYNQMASNWADGPFELIETPQYRLKVRDVFS